MTKSNTFAYHYGGKTYINLTNRCNCSCSFCLRQNANGVTDQSLWLEKEPSVEEVIAQLNEKGVIGNEVVFCGYGEPTFKLDELLTLSKRIKILNKNIKVRLNTNGLGSALHGKNIVPLLAKNIDAISVSLNAPNVKRYDDICKSSFGLKAFDYIIAFTKECVKAKIDTTMSVVSGLTIEEINECKKIAADLGAKFRQR